MDVKLLFITAVDYFGKFLEIVILIRIIISWLPIDRNNPIVQLIYSLTEPILGPIRRLLFKSPLGGPGMMLDFSPIIAVFLIQFVSSVVISLIASL